MYIILICQRLRYLQQPSQTFPFNIYLTNKKAVTLAETCPNTCKHSTTAVPSILLPKHSS